MVQILKRKKRWKPQSAFHLRDDPTHITKVSHKIHLGLQNQDVKPQMVVRAVNPQNSNVE